ncbi:MAG TPA: ABC transporter permease, partial [Actinomycetota bacterium]|nr:ABC transporter permease [Actinomycetota bacterium]
MATVQEARREKGATPAKARPPGERSDGRMLGWYTRLVIAYLFLPVIVMIVFGFNDTAGRFNYSWQGFTLEYFQPGRLFEFQELNVALRNSVVIAAISTLVATALGSLIALALTRHRFFGRSGMNLFLFLPMATPEVVLGVALLALFVSLNLPRGFATITIAHIMFSISYVVVTVKARTSGFDRHLEDAAQDLGASPWTTFWTVTFPLILPGIIAAGLLAFVLSIDDYVITSFNAGSTITLPLWIYGASRIGIPQQVNVLGTLLFVIGVLYVIVAMARLRRAE